MSTEPLGSVCWMAKTEKQKAEDVLVTEFLSDFYSKFSEFDGASILVTGGTGSFGRSFIRHILENHKPKRLIVFSRDELKQFEMERQFSHQDHSCIRYFLGDVRDAARLEMAMEGVDYVVHAAALKHVALTEYNPFECVLTNIIGAQNIVTAARRSGVKKVVALSTDKAASPINLYGATKLASDKIFIAANNLTSATGCKFSVVRYGNVLNSRGSVIPFFKELISKGADFLPITDDRMTRFVVTLDQGVALICKAFTFMKGGEILVPKIPSLTIMDLAEAMAPNIPTNVVGIRPGEKIHEVLIPREDARNSVDIGNCYVVTPNFPHSDYKLPTGMQGKLLPDGFEYDSFTNGWRLSVSEIRQLLSGLS